MCKIKLAHTVIHEKDITDFEISHTDLEHKRGPYIIFRISLNNNYPVMIRVKAEQHAPGRYRINFVKELEPGDVTDGNKIIFDKAIHKGKQGKLAITGSLPLIVAFENLCREFKTRMKNEYLFNQAQEKMKEAIEMEQHNQGYKRCSSLKNTGYAE